MVLQVKLNAFDISEIPLIKYLNINGHQFSCFVLFSILGFMDALSDPKGYLSAQEKEQAKRAEALAKIGIDETEIDTTNVILGKGNIFKLMNRK